MYFKPISQERAQEMAVSLLLAHKNEKRFIPPDVREVLEFVARGAKVSANAILA